MALPNTLLSGYAASLWVQTGSPPVPLTTTQLATWTAEVTTIVGASANGTGGAGEQLNVESIPAFGRDDASVNFAVAGSRESDVIPVQAKPTSMTITAPWNPSDPGLLLMRADSDAGNVDRTYVIACTSGANTIAYAFNARVGQFHIESATNSEAKCVFTLHRRGNQFGICNNT